MITDKYHIVNTNQKSVKALVLIGQDKTKDLYYYEIYRQISRLNRESIEWKIGTTNPRKS